MKKWTIEDSKELYNICGWGTSYFGINDKGDVYVTPCKDNTQIDLRDIMDELALRDINAPVLLRFPDILVEFPDLKFKSSDPVATFNHYLNAEMGEAAPEADAAVYSQKSKHTNYGSVREYFKFCSEGKFTPQFDVVGPVTMNERYAYYGRRVNGRKTVLIYGYILAWQSYLDFTRLVGIRCVEHHITLFLFLLCLAEEVADTRCTYADKHFHEVGTAH